MQPPGCAKLAFNRPKSFPLSKISATAIKRFSCCHAAVRPARVPGDVRTNQSRQFQVNQSDDLLRFIGSSFRSVWALELLLVLKRQPRPWPPEELVSTMRSSELVVSKAIDGLVSAGLASFEEEGAVYMPVNDEVAARVDQLEKLYAARPDAVRRAIVSASASGATAFADAFKLRKD